MEEAPAPFLPLLQSVVYCTSPTLLSDFRNGASISLSSTYFLILENSISNVHILLLSVAVYL
jgi:hypothetical protein